MGIDALIVNHSRKIVIHAWAREQGFYRSAWANFTVWLMQTHWHGCEVQIIGENSVDADEPLHGAWPPDPKRPSYEPIHLHIGHPFFDEWNALWADATHDGLAALEYKAHMRLVK